MIFHKNVKQVVLYSEWVVAEFDSLSMSDEAAAGANWEHTLLV
jgi:hypothetical protein